MNVSRYFLPENKNKTIATFANCVRITPQRPFSIIPRLIQPVCVYSIPLLLLTISTLSNRRWRQRKRQPTRKLSISKIFHFQKRLSEPHRIAIFTCFRNCLFLSRDSISFHRLVLTLGCWTETQRRWTFEFDDEFQLARVDREWHETRNVELWKWIPTNRFLWYFFFLSKINNEE